MHFSVRQFKDSNGAIEIDHPPYSPDLASCDYYWLFDFLLIYLINFLSKTLQL